MQCIRAFPNELKLCSEAIRKCLKAGDGPLIFEGAEMVFRLAPRDPDRRQLYWTALVAAYCDACSQRDTERMATLWTRLDDFSGEPKSPVEMLALEAATAMKRGEWGVTDQKPRESQTPSRFALAVHIAVAASQMNVSKTTRAGLCQDVAKLVKERKSGKAAAEAVRAIRRLPTTLQTVSETLVQPLSAYLKSCGRVQWEKDDLLEVCRFLFEHKGDQKTLFKLAKQGTARFQRSAHFHIYRALTAPRSIWGGGGLNVDDLSELIRTSPEPLSYVEESAFQLLDLLTNQRWDEEDEWD